MSTLKWSDMKFPPINLLSAPSLKVITFTIKGLHGKQRYSTQIKPNPLYEQRKSS